MIFKKNCGPECKCGDPYGTPLTVESIDAILTPEVMDYVMNKVLAATNPLPDPTAPQGEPGPKSDPDPATRRSPIGTIGTMTAFMAKPTRSKNPCPSDPLDRTLAEARELINGERQEQYGPAEPSFHAIAKLWSAWITRRHPPTGAELKLTPRDVAILMVLFKCSREAGSPKHDNIVDIIGYAALADKL